MIPKHRLITLIVTLILVLYAQVTLALPNGAHKVATCHDDWRFGKHKKEQHLILHMIVISQLESSLQIFKVVQKKQNIRNFKTW